MNLECMDMKKNQLETPKMKKTVLEVKTRETV